MANLEKLPSGSYRYRKTMNGHKISLIFDHKPDDVELALALAEKTKSVYKGENKKFIVCAKEYIVSRESVLSPSTANNYESIVRNLGFIKDMKINDISQIEVQADVNNYASTHSPKSTANYSGFVTAVVKAFRPDVVLKITLPQRIEKKAILPTEEDIKTILNETENTEYHVAFQLAIMGARRSEICALDISDLDENLLTISKGKVKDKNKQWIIKPYPKNTSSNRTLYLPDDLANEIRDKGYVYKNSPDTLEYTLRQIQKRHNMEQFNFHSLRHYFASYAHYKGIPDVYIMQMGGWSTDNVMKRVYRQAMEEKTLEMQKSLVNSMFN